MEGKKILLGVTGGIAAFKSISVASLLTKLGANVRVAMTESAMKLVSPKNFHEVTKNPVTHDLWKETDLHPHIDLANFAELVLIAPATANFIAKMAHGIADDLLSTTMLALKSNTPVLIAPAMNTRMLEHPATRKNLEILKSRGVKIIEPDSGLLACGDIGRGRLPEPQDLVEFVQNFLRKKTLEGKQILITAGGTRERLDSVRFLGNPSSGKMGFALAEESAARGADVVLLTAPTFLSEPRNEKIKTIRVESALEMHDAAIRIFPNVDAVIMTAAVADFRPSKVFEGKIKKSKDNPDEKIKIELVRNPDILLELGTRKTPNQVLIGFAAEMNDLETYARDKIQRKNLDFIVANDVSKSDAGFAVDTNIATIFFRDDSKIDLPLMEKSELAGKILDQLQKIFEGGNSI
ncbi:MAG: bifunctional phosphopantothenoylcysteine decarboxylase/phosphopantothenate--cysteine ligase CoaBC [Selenomonadaceae bacterium]|nr:bifunctional phosphopantothenoylcysteine decarboxylase/phosphopantothenate--cysteine ligase CoaBC [Selenomonadaceae bacterium]